jgi:hypothetical protein
VAFITAANVRAEGLEVIPEEPYASSVAPLDGDPFGTAGWNRWVIMK